MKPIVVMAPADVLGRSFVPFAVPMAEPSFCGMVDHRPAGERVAVTLLAMGLVVRSARLA
jgi:hypothetical protein